MPLIIYFSSRLILWALLWSLVWFVASLALKRQDIADVAWGLGIASLPLIFAGLILSDGTLSYAGWTALVLVVLWALRLALHIGTRLIGKKEDARYAAWRKDWGKWFPIRSYLQVFLLQALLSIIISLPALASLSVKLTINYTIVTIGAAIFLIGLFFEAIGDWQLRVFLKDKANKGKIMTKGLWRYTRHPNYFGEVSLWWGMWLVAVGVHPMFWWTIVSPLLISFLILKVSGIPMLERRWEGNRAFAKYKKETNAFFPGPVRR